MKPILGCVAFLGLGACTQTPSQQLAELPPFHVEVYAYADTPRVTTGASSTVDVIFQGTVGCSRISDDVTATLDGQPLTLITAGGRYDDFSGKGCETISFSIDHFTAEPNTISTLVIHDDSATWTIEAADLMTADFSLAGTVAANQQVAVTWDSADSISLASYAQLTDANGQVTWTTFAGNPDADREAATIHGNAIDLRLPTTVNPGDVLTVASGREATPITCEGPASCLINVSASADFSR